ncbi:MAG: hypothetical protein DRQ39_03755 [Gammaproteobacteria bacterium]|nr:MAG: hypothetical protein DRQ39_03755 [Gammaproteobacteria bacterium]
MTTLLYPSAQNVDFSRDQLEQLPTPTPLGRFHNPYPFAAYVDDIHHALSLEGIEVLHEEYVTSHENQRLFGALEVAIEGEFIAKGEAGHKYIVGLRGAHDQSIQRGICLGTQVMVCSNLCFNGNLGNLATKQTTNVGARIPGLVREAVHLLPEYTQANERRFEIYKESQLTPDHVNSILINLLRQGAISAPQLAKALVEWDTPSHEEHAEHGASVWRLFNACTEALKPGGANFNPHLLADRSAAIVGYIDSTLAIAA